MSLGLLQLLQSSRHRREEAPTDEDTATPGSDERCSRTVALPSMAGAATENVDPVLLSGSAKASKLATCGSGPHLQMSSAGVLFVLSQQTIITWR